MATTNYTTVGVDGCRGGWFALISDGASIKGLIVNTLAQLLELLPDDSIVAIDVPIGLPDSGPRTCDVEARRRLGAKRGTSVFPAAVRPVLTARDYADACSIHVSTDGRKISKQSYAILPKIREIDDLIRGSARAQGIVREVHPEVTFAIWNDGRALTSSKKKVQGRMERESLIDGMWPGIRVQVSSGLPRERVKRDDVNDAFAALWTANRIANGIAIRIPNYFVLDSLDLPMQIWA